MLLPYAKVIVLLPTVKVAAPDTAKVPPTDAFPPTVSAGVVRVPVTLELALAVNDVTDTGPDEFNWVQ